jgi:predicted glycosyltransferase involved in capsule biosynthesis
MSFSFIVAYRHNPEREKNLRKIFNWISQFDCEIIMVESDASSKIELFKDYKINHIFLQNNYPFNKSWCFNVGYKNAKFDKIVFGDADLVMNSKSFLSSLDLLNEYDCVNPYSSVIDLTPEETEHYLNNEDFSFLEKIERHGRGDTDNQKVPMCGGIIMFTKEGLNKIAGWNEDFWGWGAEDDCISIKVKWFLKHENIKDRCYHLYHTKAPIDTNLYYRNLTIYNHFLNAPKENFIPYISQVAPTIGKIDKKIN